jgi:ubiquinone/menaquinone biosynthesis C-methylase UbiE
MDKTKIAVEIFDKLADVYEGKFMDVSMYGDTFDLFCNSIQKQHPDVLELACGPGNITRYLLNKRPDLKILGTDLAPKMLELALQHNPEAIFKIMDCRDLGKLDRQYDAVMCGFGLPYLSKEDAIKLIHDASSILTDGGILYISTMEDDYSKSGLRSGSSGDQMYMHYHQADYLTTALEENGFKIIGLTRKEYPAGDGTDITDLVIVAGK